MKERIKSLLTREPSSEIITAEGWVRTKRDSKNVCFLEINDGSCLKGLQAVIDKASFNNNNLLDSISTGAAVSVKGTIVESLGGNQKVELAVTSLVLVGPCPNDYPLQKKRHTVEFLREQAYLRPRTNLFGAVTRVRNTMAYAVHQFRKMALSMSTLLLLQQVTVKEPASSSRLQHWIYRTFQRKKTEV